MLISQMTLEPAALSSAHRWTVNKENDSTKDRLAKKGREVDLCSCHTKLKSFVKRT